MVRLRSVTKPYSCVCTSIWLAHCTRCAGVLGCVRPMGSSLVCWWMRHINHTCQGYFVQLVELNCKPRLAPIETCLTTLLVIGLIIVVVVMLISRNRGIGSGGSP